MEPRTIAIGLIAVIAAFAGAFGISSSGGGKTATAGPGTKASTIKVATPAAVSGVQVGGTVPALRSAPKPVHKKKAAKKHAPSTTSSAPSTSSTQPAPSTQNSAPAPVTPQQSAPVAPRPSAPKPSAPKPSSGPVVGGGTDG